MRLSLKIVISRGRRHLRPSSFFLCGALALLVSSARADDVRDLFDSVGHPQLSFGMTSASRRTMTTQPGSYSQQTTTIAAAIPFAGSLTDGTSLWSIYASLRAAAADVSVLPKNVTLFSGRLGVSDRISSDRNTYFLFAALGFASDDASLDDARLRFSGTGMATHALDRSIALHYGLIYSYALGRGLLLPLAGVRWIPADRFSLDVVLPVSIRAHYRADEQWSFGASAALDGDRFQFSNDGNFAAAPNRAYLRLSQIECGMDIDLQFSSLILVSGEAGVAVFRRLWISSDNGDYFSSRISSGGFVRAKVAFCL